jgi:hypothetical protein
VFRSVRPHPAALVLLALAPGLAACGSSSPARPAGAGAAQHTTAPSPTKEVSPAGDIPDNQVYVRYAVPGAGYSVRVPEGWSRISRGGAVVFTDKLNAIRLEAGAPASHAGRATVVHRRAGTARKLTYVAQAPPDPVTGKAVTDAVERYVFSHGGRTAVLTLSGPRGADNVDPWRIVTDSLRWTG